MKEINSMVKRWTTKEVQYLKRAHKKQTLEHMANHLGRTVKSVREKSRRIGINAVPEYSKFLYLQEYAYYIGEEFICIGSIFEIAEKVGIKWETLAKYRHPSNMKRLNRRLVEV